jgi:hypothetical protein
MSFAGADAPDVRVAAENNAALCDAVCRAHGIDGTFRSDMWSSARRTPPFYPDAVTLDPAVTADRVVAAVDGTAGCSVKDSFASLDLAPRGFRVLFAAEWIARPTDEHQLAGPTGRVSWGRVDDARVLMAWERAWTESGTPIGLFRPALLDRLDVVVLGGSIDETIVAGAVLNRSDTVVGISNVFTTVGGIDELWTGCLAAVGRHVPDTPIVGYESGAALDAARRHGFGPLGPLRVWIHD